MQGVNFKVSWPWPCRRFSCQLCCRWHWRARLRASLHSRLFPHIAGGETRARGGKMRTSYLLKLCYMPRNLIEMLYIDHFKFRIKPNNLTLFYRWRNKRSEKSTFLKVTWTLRDRIRTQLQVLLSPLRVLFLVPHAPWQAAVETSVLSQIQITQPVGTKLSLELIFYNSQSPSIIFVLLIWNFLSNHISS